MAGTWNLPPRPAAPVAPALATAADLAAISDFNQQMRTMRKEAPAAVPPATLAAGLIQEHSALHDLSADAAAGPAGAAAPAWFGPAMASALAAALAPTNRAIADLRTAVAASNAISFARLANSRKRFTEPLVPVPNDANVVPPAFPATPEAVTTLNAAQCQALLVFYRLPVPGTVAARRAAIREYIGIE